MWFEAKPNVLTQHSGQCKTDLFNFPPKYWYFSSNKLAAALLSCTLICIVSLSTFFIPYRMLLAEQQCRSSLPFMVPDTRLEASVISSVSTKNHKDSKTSVTAFTHCIGLHMYEAAC